MFGADVVSATLSNSSRKPLIRLDLDTGQKMAVFNFPIVAPRKAWSQSRPEFHSIQNISSSGSANGGNDVGPCTTVLSRRRFGSVHRNRRASFVNGQFTENVWRVSRLHASNISETASTTTGSLGRNLRVRRLMRGQSVGNLGIVNAAITVGKLGVNEMRISVVFGERKRGINGVKSLVAFIHSKTSSLGNKGSSPARDCSANRTSEVIRSLVASTVSDRIPRAYFRIRIHSTFVGSLVKDFLDGTIR